MVFILLITSMILLSKTISGKWDFSSFVSGSLIGLFFEVYYEFCWDYDVALEPFIWRDVSLIVILGWGAITQLALSISDYFSLKYSLNHLQMFLLDVFIIYIFLFVNERVMSSLGFWSYNNDLHPQFLAQLFGFILLSFIISNVTRRVQNLIRI